MECGVESGEYTVKSVECRVWWSVKCGMCGVCGV